MKYVICDLDGTLALLNGRDPYDQARCAGDLVNVPVQWLLGAMLPSVRVILMSGRWDTYRELTQTWLEEQGISYNALYMRKEGDTRKDPVIKEDLFNQFLVDFNAKKEDVLFVLDDRNQVVDFWRKTLGLTCFQVNYGDF